MEGRGIHVNYLKHHDIAEKNKPICLTETGNEDEYQTKLLQC